jgi:hypothetical protein
VDRARLEEQVRALDEGRAFLLRSNVRATWVGGSEARGWLQDLITADVAGLRPFQTRRSLLLTPTGRIRADFHVMGFGDARQSFVLVQAEDQPHAVADALRPYVLSSDVDLRPAPFELVSVPASAVPDAPSDVWRPSVLGHGWDLLTLPGGPAEDVVHGLERAGLVEASDRAAEAWRIRRGVPRFPVDIDEDSLPAESGLDDQVTIDRTKGCYLGQESVAKVRNLGHPARVVLALRSSVRVDAGATIVTRGATTDEEVGLVTSADALPEGSALIARVRWDARGADLRTRSGAPLEPR